jgi:hypothetical protein
MKKLLGFVIATLLATGCGSRTTSGYDYSEKKDGMMTIKADRLELGKLLQYAFTDLAKKEKAAVPHVEGDASLLARKVSKQCSATNQTDLIGKLQDLGSCIIEVKEDGTRIIVTSSTSQPNHPSDHTR